MPSPYRTFITLVRDGPLEEEQDRFARFEEFFRENPSYLDPEEEAPIATAVHHRCSTEVLRYLIGKGCGGVDKKMTFQTERDAKTPLCIATRWGRADLVHVLLQAGANHAKRSGIFRTPPIVYAVQDKKRDTAILQHLLRHDPHQVDSTDCNGVTALRSAAKYGNMDAVRLLLSRGANPTLADNKGYTALSMCTSGAFFPFSYFHEDVDTIATNRRQIAHLLQEEDRAYLVYKGYAIEDGLLAKREFQRDMFSILHLSDPLKLRICRKKTLPFTLYTAQGYRTRPGGDVVRVDPATIVQEVLYEIWTTMKRDVFGDLMQFLVH
jgi:hypothetical protein